MKSNEIKLGDVTFDPTTRALYGKDGRQASLRNKSKEVLVRLLESPNSTVSKADIISSVWSDVTVSDESLVQCVADIRKAIGDNTRQIVETVPRQGYRLNLPEQDQGAKFALPSGLYLMAALAAAAMIVWVFFQTAAPEALEPVQAAPTQGVPGTHSTEAYLEVLKGRISSNRFSFDESLVAERHFRKAIELDPSFARAHAELATLFAVRFENSWTILVEADRQKALYYAEQALLLEPDLWLAHYALGRLHSVFGDLAQAQDHLETALSLEPDNEDARAYLGVVHNFKGDAASAAAILQQAVASHPDPPYWYYYGLGHAQFNLRRYVEAQDALETCLERAPNSPYCLRYLLGVYGATGNQTKAEAAGQTYASMGFELSVRAIVELMASHHADDRTQLRWALRQAQLPE